MDYPTYGIRYSDGKVFETMAADLESARVDLYLAQDLASFHAEFTGAELVQLIEGEWLEVTDL